MNAEFNWWLLIVGLGIGAGLAWLVLADMGRRRDATADRERADETAWIETTLRDDGVAVAAGVVDRVLDLHEIWLDRSSPESRDAVPIGTHEPVDEPAAPGPVASDETGGVEAGSAAEDRD